MRDMGYEVHLLPLTEGPLESDFSALGVHCIRETNFTGFDLVILNTAVSARVVPNIPNGVKFLMWLHESPLLFVHSELPFIVAQAAKRAVGILFPTEATAQDWARYGPLRSDALAIFHSLAPVSIPPLSTEAKRLLTEPVTTICPLRIISIDPLEYFRGHRVLSRALEYLISKGIDVEYTAAGASPSAIRSLFSFLPNNRLIAPGRIPRIEVLECLARSHIYVSASAFATQNLGLCEAVLMGVPAVVSDIPVHRSFSASLPAAIKLTRLFDWRSIAITVEALYENYFAWRLISRRSVSHAEKYLSADSMKEVLRWCLALDFEDRHFLPS
jgi:glycosyltransferase involved in cell wall biosynthesis